MRSDRRRLLCQAVGLALAAAGGVLPAPLAADRHERAVVLARTGDGLIAIDTETGDWQPWGGPVPATPTPDGATTPPSPVPGMLVHVFGDAPVTWWRAAPDYTSFICRIGGGDGATWWWIGHDGSRVQLDLPPDLELAYHAGRAARWFHGATIDAAHLGAGTLRLVGIDVATGEIVLDQELDRRLELAATAVSEGGEIVAHVQAGNASVELWAIDLRRSDSSMKVATIFDPAPVAASAIDLRVAADGEWMVVAAGIAWASPDHPEPMVIVTSSREPGTVVTIEIEGELVGIVPAVNQAG